MNCKQKALLSGLTWGVSGLMLITAALGFFWLITSLAETYGIANLVVGLIGTGSIIFLFVAISNVGYKHYLETHSEEN